MGVDGHRHTPATLPPGERPVTHCTVWALEPVWTGAENHTPIGIRSPDCRSHIAVAVLTALSWSNLFVVVWQFSDSIALLCLYKFYLFIYYFFLPCIS